VPYFGLLWLVQLLPLLLLLVLWRWLLPML
jgi:hypothetical protein